MSASRTEELSLKSPSDTFVPSDSETGGDIGGDTVGDEYIAEISGDDGNDISFKWTERTLGDCLRYINDSSKRIPVGVSSNPIDFAEVILRKKWALSDYSRFVHVY
jgi:hypothetical protein